MTSRLNLILIVGCTLAALTVAVVFWARAVGLLQPGDAAPILGLSTLVLIAVVLWVERRRASAAKA